MAQQTEREKAKAAITGTSDDDPEFDSAMSGAHKFELQKRRDDQKHKETILKADRGALGGVFGNSQNAASNAAFIVIICGVLMIGVCIIGAANSNDPESWTIWAERSFALVATALAYLFGKSSA